MAGHPGGFPSGSLYLTVDEGRLPEPPKPGSLDAQLVKRIREGMTIDEMAKVLHASDFLVYQRLYALYRLEAVKVSSTPPPRRQRPRRRRKKPRRRWWTWT